MTVTMSLQHLPVALWVDSAGTEVVMQTILVTSEIVWSAHLDRAVAQASLVAQAERRMRANAPRSSSDDASDDDAGGTARVNKGNDGEYVPGLAERQAFQRVKTHIMANIRDLTNRITADVMVGASAHLRNVDAARDGVAPGTGTAASSPGHVRRGTIGVVPRRRTTVGASGTRVGGSGVGGNTFAPSLASIPARGKGTVKRRRRSALAGVLTVQELRRLGLGRKSKTRRRRGAATSTRSASSQREQSGAKVSPRARPGRAGQPRVEQSRVAVWLRLATTSNLITQLTHARDVTDNLEAELCSGHDPAASEWYTVHPRVVGAQSSGGQPAGSGMGGSTGSSTGSSGVRVVLGVDRGAARSDASIPYG